MKPALHHCDRAIELVARQPVDGLPAEELKFAALELQRLIDQLTVQHARVIFEADRTRAWAGDGARNVADWLAGKTKSSYRDAKKKQELGESMSKSKKLSDAVGNGELSPDAASKLHDAITNPPEGADPDELVEACKGATPNEARDAADRWNELHKPETEEEAEARRYANRSLKASAPNDGQVTITLVAPTLQARKVLLVAGFLGGKPSPHDDRTTAQRMADGLIQLAEACAKGEVRGGREKPTILITFPADAYEGRTDEPGVTAHGDQIPAHIVRRLAENAKLQRVILAGSRVLDLGRSVEFATHQQYLALVARDGRCRFPGCHIPAAWCEVDHFIPRSADGPTDIDNMGLWCTHHHTFRHLPGVTLLGDTTNLRLVLADGRVIHCPPRRLQAAA